MFYLIAADIVVIAHLLWILFLIFGALPGRRHKWIRRFHIGGLLFAFYIQIINWYCPLTYLEVWLRNMHDPSLSYSGSFIIHYVEQVVYVNLPSKIILVMTVGVSLISAYLYLHKTEEKGYNKK